MSGELNQANQEQAALVARRQYMMLGTNVNLAAMPIDDAKRWVDDVRGVRLEPHAQLDVGWLEMETGITLGEHEEAITGDRYQPSALFDSATERWQRIALTNGNSAQLRAESELALSSLQAYRALIDTQALPDFGKMQTHQLAAARLLLKEYDRRHDPELTHDLHNTTLLMLLTRYVVEANLFATLLPPRFDEVGSNSRSDLLA